MSNSITATNILHTYTQVRLSYPADVANSSVYLWFRCATVLKKSWNMQMLQYNVNDDYWKFMYTNTAVLRSIFSG